MDKRAVVANICHCEICESIRILSEDEKKEKDRAAYLTVFGPIPEELLAHQLQTELAFRSIRSIR